MGGIKDGNGLSGSNAAPFNPEIIEITQADFLTAVSGGALTFPATYKITDIQNGLFVNTLSANRFSNEA